MSDRPPKASHHPTTEERDERVTIPADFEEVLRAALAVDRESEPVEDDAKRQV